MPFQPTKAIFVGVDVLLSVHTPLLFSIRSLCNIRIRQAVTGVSASFDALDHLFGCVANFLRRFHIHTDEISLSLKMPDIVIKIMVEILSVLALATKNIKQGRFSE